MNPVCRTRIHIRQETVISGRHACYAQHTAMFFMALSQSEQFLSKTSHKKMQFFEKREKLSKLSRVGQITVASALNRGFFLQDLWYNLRGPES